MTADYDKMKKLFFVTNVDWFFISHRLPLALNAIQQGYEVYLLSRDTGRKQFLQGKGIRFIDIPFYRPGSNPLHELKCIFQLYTNYKKYARLPYGSYVFRAEIYDTTLPPMPVILHTNWSRCYQKSE